MKMEQSVPKRRHINFRRRGITQKEAYNTSSFCLPFIIQGPKMINNHMVAVTDKGTFHSGTGREGPEAE